MSTSASTSSAIVQTWNGGAALELDPRIGPLYHDTPRVGMVVGTFAAVPYVHLQLEARRRYYPDVPLLVHDDGSKKTSALHALCREYGCDFEHNDRRQRPGLGDVSAFVGGLAWAAAHKIEVLVKVSRRWVFQTNWVPSLQELALQSQYATFCSYTTTFDYGFRTECVGLAVDVWNEHEFLADALQHIKGQREVFVEAYIHEFARRFERRNCETAERWRAEHPMRSGRHGYALWTLMGTDRAESSPYHLWHNNCTPEDYLDVSREWDLNYTLDDFADPNQGEGRRVKD